MRRSRILVPLAVMLLVSACGPADNESPAAPPAAPSATSASASASAAAAAAVSAEARAACKLAAEAPRTGEAIEIDEKLIKAIIAKATTSGLESIERAGAQVRAGYSTWLDAAIGDEAASAQDDLLDAVGRLNNACTDAKIPSP